MGCLLGLFTWPRALFYWARENGLKGWIVLAVIVFVLLLGVVVVESAIKNSINTVTPSYTDQLVAPGPTRAEAPYKIVTDTRVYYALIAIENNDGTVTMTNYYELLHKNEWVLTEGVLVLDDNYGTIEVTKRPLNE